MAPSVLLQMVGPRVANHVLEHAPRRLPRPLPALADAGELRRGQGRDRRPRAGAALARRDPRDRARGARRRDPPPAGRRRRRGGEGRRHGAAARRRLAVLARRDHQVPRPGRHFGQDVRAPARRDRRGGARSMSDNWRIRIELDETVHGEHAARAPRARPRLGRGQAPRRGARRATGSRSRTTTTRSSSTSDARPQAEQARADRRGRAAEEGIAGGGRSTEHWLAEEERWSGEPPPETWEQEELEHGHAPWEVRVELPSHDEADKLADQLESEGYDVVRRWRYLIVGVALRGRRKRAREARARRGRAGRRGRLGGHATEPVRGLRRPRRLGRPAREIGYDFGSVARPLRLHASALSH